MRVTRRKRSPRSAAFAPSNSLTLPNRSAATADASALAYSVAWTQHTTGVQIIRCASIVQLLLGNIGRPGGGIMALRGHASIQGSTDISTLYNVLPGYIPMPIVGAGDTFRDFVDRHTTPGGWWTQFPKYL